MGFLLLLIGLGVAAKALDRPRVEFPAGEVLDLAAHEAAVRDAVAGAARRPLGAGERIDPNVAPAAELQRLPRVGPALAGRIIAAREEAAFVTADDLRRVPGIGPALAQSLAPYLLLRDAPAEVAGQGRAAVQPSPAWQPAGAAALQPPPVSRPPLAAWQPPASGGAGAGAGGRIAINRAAADELVALPGVGPVLAARIVAYRDTAGPFRAASDLERVPGIGPALRQRLAPLVEFPP